MTLEVREIQFSTVFKRRYRYTKLFAQQSLFAILEYIIPVLNRISLAEFVALPHGEIIFGSEHTFCWLNLCVSKTILLPRKILLNYPDNYRERQIRGCITRGRNYRVIERRTFWCEDTKLESQFIGFRGNFHRKWNFSFFLENATIFVETNYTAIVATP